MLVVTIQSLLVHSCLLIKNPVYESTVWLLAIHYEDMHYHKRLSGCDHLISQQRVADTSSDRDWQI